MGLLENEKWEDYIDKEVYVSKDYGQTGFLGEVKDYNDKFVMIENKEGEEFEIKHSDAYGTWILEDW